MKFDILSEDRLGITQKILAVFGQQGWDLRATEMQPHHTYVACDVPETQQALIVNKLMQVDGVLGVQAISLLPNEHRRNHLDALLSHLPDAVLDIDANGQILVANQAAQLALLGNPGKLEESFIKDYLDIDLQQLLNKGTIAQEISTSNGAFLMQSTPVKSGNLTTGAVILLSSPERLGQQLSAVQANVQAGIDSIIGQSSKMRTIKQQTMRFSALDLPVLITGETGTGKELFAKALHYEGPRKSEPFLTINCAALPENLLESELFGYANGAFSGAQKGGKPGLFELANNGTVFLDEIGEMSLYLQAKLLRFLEDLTFRRIGGTREITVDVRIVCATHRDLEQMTLEKTFREDLFYRLNVLALNLPALREREQDLDLLVPHFLHQASEQINQPQAQLSQQALAQIRQHPWPGNVRQLQNTLFRTVAMNDSDTIEWIDNQDNAASGKPASHDVLPDNLLSEKVVSLQQSLDEFEKQLLTTLYPQYPSSRKLAKRLGLSHSQIARKLAKHNINSI